MQRQPVESEAVNSIGHQETVLEVEFSDGRVYRYFPVPESTYRDLMNADSIGNFVATKIKPNFDVQRTGPRGSPERLSAGSPSSARRHRSAAGR